MQKSAHNKFMGLKEYFINRKKKKFKKKYKVGLCLSGGGVRGFAYIGAFKAFEENNIKFDMVAGASAGSLFGALYCSQLSYEDMCKLTKNVKNSDFRKPKLGFLPSKTDILQNKLKEIYPIKKIENLKIPLIVTAVDLKTGKEIDFKSGDLANIVSGSCAIPGVFTPVKYKNMTLIDGGAKNNIPANVLKENGCDFVVTIDCNCTRGGGTTSDSLVSQFIASIGITMVNNSILGKKCSDIVICPDMTKFNSLKITDVEAMINQGYKATIEAFPLIEQLFLGKLKKKNGTKEKFNS